MSPIKGPRWHHRFFAASWAASRAASLTLLARYLPLILMALLAAFTTWLVRQTPVPDVTQAARVVRHEPDYEMSRFKVQRFGKDGRLKLEILGDRLRHYPDTQTLEIDNPRIRGLGPEGRTTLAWARHAVAGDDGNQLRLEGGARVRRTSPLAPENVEFRSEFLQAMLKTEEVRTHLPVVFQSGTAQLSAGGVQYRHRDQFLQFQGQMKAVFAPGGAPP
jgi:lipopolysaccharide export system protein LptC